MNISELVPAGAMPSREIVVRGKTCRITALTAAQTGRLQSLWVRPQPPMIREPGTHPERGPLCHNDRDATYRHALDKWVRRFQAVGVAAALDLAVPGVGSGKGFQSVQGESDEVLKLWAEAAHLAIASNLGDGEVLRIWAMVEHLSDPWGEDGDRIERAKKALSELSHEERKGLHSVFFPSDTGSAPSSSSGGAASGSDSTPAP